MEDIRSFLKQLLEEAGNMSLSVFGRLQEVRIKTNQSHVVTDTDVAIERFMTEKICRVFPGDGIIGKETGFRPGISGAFWILDLLDGSSNFTADVPWFGVMAVRVVGGVPLQAGIYLHVAGEMYLAQKGQGATVNDIPVRITSGKLLSDILVAYGIDVLKDREMGRRETETIGLLVESSRDLRATNTVFDFCAVATGKFGTYPNRSSRIWANAVPQLFLEKAGGTYTGFAGQRVALDTSTGSLGKNYEYIDAASHLQADYHAFLSEKR